MFTIENEKLARLAAEEARQANPRLKNWYKPPEPCSVACSPGSFRSYRTKRYSRYVGYDYAATYESWYQITTDRRVLLYHTREGSCPAVAPKGCEWGHDANGLMLQRQKDGAEYHPVGEELAERHTKKWWLSRIADTAEKRRKIDEERQADAAFERCVETANVTLHDSQRAGNCVRGTLAFLSRQFSLSKEGALAAPFLTVPAECLNLTNDLQKRAAVCAAQRETLISI